MKALTIWQPYASLIVLGYKHFETRSWWTNISGKVAIHAAKYHKLPHEVYEEIAEAIGIPPEKYRGSWLYYLENGVPSQSFGAILGTVDMEPSVPANSLRLSRAELALGDYSPGRFAWPMKNATQFPTPIPASGHQGLWEWNEKERTA